MSIQSLPLGLITSYMGFALELQAQALADGDQALADDAFAKFAILDDELARRVELSTPPTQGSTDCPF